MINQLWNYLLNGGRGLKVLVGVGLLVAHTAQASLLYETDFSAGSVTNEWALNNNAEIEVGTGLNLEGGWGDYNAAQLTGDAELDIADLTATVTVDGNKTGNESTFAEIALRTDDTFDGTNTEWTSGVYLRVFREEGNANIFLFDAGNQLDSFTLANFNPENNKYVMKITAAGTSVQGTVYKYDDPDIIHTLTGTVQNALGSGNVRIQGRAHTEGPLITAVSIIPEPSTFLLVAAGVMGLFALRRRL